MISLDDNVTADIPYNKCGIACESSSFSRTSTGSEVPMRPIMTLELQ